MLVQSCVDVLPLIQTMAYSSFWSGNQFFQNLLYKMYWLAARHKVSKSRSRDAILEHLGLEKIFSRSRSHLEPKTEGPLQAHFQRQKFANLVPLIGQVQASTALHTVHTVFVFTPSTKTTICVI